MRAQTIGRVLGIGVRVAGRIAGERLGTAAQTNTATAPQTVRNAPLRPAEVGRRAARTSTGIARGLGGFFRPFRRVGRILWLEITGAFFFLPVVAFTPNLWRMRASWNHGPDHNMFLVTAGVMLVISYLGVTSFWRARR